MPDAPQEVRTFFVTSVTRGRRAILQTAPMAALFLDVLRDNRARERFLVHEFVLMPDHFHALLTPARQVSLEKAVQFIKGGFSFRARQELGFNGEIWQESFTEHRIRNSADYDEHRKYIRENPVRRFLVQRAEDFRYSSAHPDVKIDSPPSWIESR